MSTRFYSSPLPIQYQRYELRLKYCTIETLFEEFSSTELSSRERFYVCNILLLKLFMRVLRVYIYFMECAMDKNPVGQA